MAVISKIKQANFKLDKSLRLPEALRHLILADGTVPAWLQTLREQHFELISDCIAEDKTRELGAINRGRWIKKDNFVSGGGIRKRKPTARPPTRSMNRPLTLAQYQRHSIHLLSSLLNVRSNTSPFTLVLDDLNQRATQLTGELVRRALSRNLNVVVIAFEHTRFHPAVQAIHAYADLTAEQILSELKLAMGKAKESLVIVDSLYDLLANKGVNMSALFHLVANKFASTLVGVYHQDMLAATAPPNPYAPPPLDLLKYMATSILTCKSFAHVLAAKAARARSLPEPTEGLLQGAEGIVESLTANDARGIVLDAEFRRHSGRVEHEVFFLRTARAADYHVAPPGLAYGCIKAEFATLLALVPTYASDEVLGKIVAGAAPAAEDKVQSTFNLELTEKQKREREGVVLPYFDAQKGEGGEGGRILYEMGEEDDFDEEEDEI